MPDFSKSTGQLVLIGLIAGLIAALGELSLQTHGLHALLGIATAGVVAACGMAWRRSSPGQGLLSAVPFVLLAMIGITWTGTSSLSLSSGLCWTAFMTCLVASLGAVSIKKLGTVESVQVRAQHQAPLSVTAATSSQGATQSWGHFEEETALLNLQDSSESDDSLNATEDQTVQTWTRVQNADEDRLEGTLIVDFESGQKQCYVHLPFQPFFHGTQAGYCECDDDCYQAEFDILQAYGARLNVRRRGNASSPGHTEVMLVITSQQFAIKAA